MDLGISGKQGIVCGASQGLGLACARALAQEGVNLILVARNPEPLQAAVESLSQLSTAKIQAVVGDITTDEGRDAVLQACPEPDILINNAGGPPPGDFRDWRQKEWFDAVNSNMYSAIDMIRRTLDGMAARGFGRIVNITSTSVKSPMPGLGLSNGARAGLSGFVAGVAREKVRDNVTINNLLPGLFATDRGRGYLAYRAAQEGVSAEVYTQQFNESSPAGRMGDPDEFGATCAFLCSAMNGYMSGQNILLDGGVYSGTC
ncbi:3-oxoacyl-ACP reductase [Gammaproteobacteria bacterium 50_400_T64]|nr:3-oxoacyl-ACP reductase [Gammaproteobacteria bacterium 50_400_T64]